MVATRLLSPVPGTVLPLTEVPDPVFAQAMVGPGVAIEPDRTGRQDVVAPCAGVIGALHPHAFAVETIDGRAVLVHVGIDTVTLAGLGFEVHVERGQRVHAGERVLTWSPVDVAAAGLSTVCPVVALQGDPGSLEQVAAEGDHVGAGQVLLEWTAG